jgi:CubicO group peptidase (beta-lactamase class C family)
MPTGDKFRRLRHHFYGWSVLAAAAAIALVALPSSASADPGDPAKPADVESIVDETIKSQLDSDSVPGATVSVVQDGDTVLSKGYGLADIESNQKVDPEKTEFFLGSSGKMFTAVAVLQLAEAGKLDMNTDVNKYIDGFDVPDSYPGKPITLQHLLTYTAGFDPDGGMFGQVAESPDDLETLQTALAKQLPQRVHPPGTVVAYDNYGLALAGLIVQDVSGQSYEDYLQEHVFDPLKMSSTTAAQPAPDSLVKRQATGYQPDGDGQAVTTAQYSSWTPSGPGQITTAADMARFMNAQLSGDKALGAGVAKKLGEQQYTSDDRLPGMGYCFEHRIIAGQPVLFKDGDVPGFHTSVILDREHDLGIYVSYNGDGTTVPAVDEVAKAVIAKLYPTKTEQPEAIEGADSSKYLGEYQVSRSTQGNAFKIKTLTTPSVTVSAGDNGEIITTGTTLSSRPEASSQRWIPVDGKGLYAEVDGESLIAFSPNGSLTSSLVPHVTYLPLPQWDNPLWYQIGLVVGLVLLFIAAIGLPIRAVVMRKKQRDTRTAAARTAQWTAWITAILSVVFTAGTAILMSDMNVAGQALLTASTPMLALTAIASVLVLGSLVMMVFAVCGWIRRWWGVSTRIWYTVTMLGAIAVGTVLSYYHLAWPAAG